MIDMITFIIVFYILRVLVTFGVIFEESGQVFYRNCSKKKLFKTKKQFILWFIPFAWVVFLSIEIIDMVKIFYNNLD